MYTEEKALPYGLFYVCFSDKLPGRNGALDRLAYYPILFPGRQSITWPKPREI